MSKTAGIVIDKWKLPIFKRRLEAAGYAFTRVTGIKGTYTLKVTVANDREMTALASTIEAAQLECAERKPQ